MLKNIERTKDNVDSLIDRTGNAVVDVADRAESGVESVAERAVETAHVAGAIVRDRTETAKRDAHRLLNDAARAIDSRYTRARGELSRAATKTTGFVAEHPGKSLALAVSAGFVLGVAMRWRRLSN